jgi:glycosyltransferase involved in cell wall biosynthesis
VYVSFERGRSLRHNVLAAITFAMATIVARASRRIYCSTTAWEPRLRQLIPGTSECLPIPSNVLVEASREVAPATRARLGAAEPGALLIGHFSSYSSLIAPLLLQWIPELLSGDSRRIAVLIGNNAGRYATDLTASNPWLADRLRVADGLSAEEVAAHLLACDLIVQPYPDGATTRRSSLMASLALGLPVVTNSGPLTEPIWKQSGAVLLLPDLSPATLQAAVDHALTPHIRAAIGARAAEYYREHFAIERTLAKLRRDAE